MKKESILYGIIGLLAGVVIAGFTAGYSVNHNSSGMMRAMGFNDDKVNTLSSQMHDNDVDTSMTMDGMVSGLKGKTGDDFDKAFVSEMIDHHQGAIDMAKLAEKNAKHDEVKSLAKDIITAQTSEITKMKSWELNWGYVNSSSSTDSTNHMMH